MQKYGIVAWSVWLLGSLYFFAEYFVRVSTGVLSPILMTEMNVGALELGALSAFFYYAYIGMQIPVGVIVDRFGAKRILVLMTAIFGLSCILFAMMPNIKLGYLYRFIMGFSGSFAFVGTLKLITIYFQPNMFAMLAGVTQGLGMLGAIIGEAPMAYAFSHYGWRNSMFWIAFVFFAITILLIFLVKDKKPNPVASITATPRTNNLMRDIKSVLSTKDMWLNCLFIGCLYAPTSTFGEQWGALFSSLDMHTTITAGAWSVGFIFMGLALGCPLIGILSDRLRNRIKVMRGCAIICFITIIIIIYHNLLGIHLSQNSLHLIMFIYGFFNSGIVPSYALSSEIIHRQVAGVALGVTNMASVIIGSLFIPIVGLLIDSVGGKASSSLSNTAFTVNSFYIAFALLPVCFIICILSSYFIKETHCKAVQE